MAAWGSGTLDNDDAQDWLGELDAEGAGKVAEAFDAVAEGHAEGYIEAPVGSAALAAAEAVAYAFDMGDPGLDDAATRIFDVEAEAVAALEDIRSRALECVDRVMEDPDRSELLELWEDADAEDAAAFREAVAGLRRRLDA